MTKPDIERQEPNPLSEKYVLRFLQRNLFLSEVTKLGQETVDRLFPKDRILNYKFENKPSDKDANILADDVYLDDLMQLFNPFDFRGDTGGYQLMFQLATTAQTPQELQNIFNGMKTIEGVWEVVGKSNNWLDYQSQRDITRESRDTFTRQSKIVNKSDLTSEGRWVEAETERIGGGAAGNATQYMQALGEKMFNPQSEEFSKYRSALAEVYLYTVLNLDYNSSWNGYFLWGSVYFPFSEGMFDQNATFWKRVDGSWVGLPDSPEKIPAGRNIISEFNKKEKDHLDASVQSQMEILQAKIRNRELEERLKLFREETEKVAGERDRALNALNVRTQESHRLSQENSRLNQRVSELIARVNQLEVTLGSLAGSPRRGEQQYQSDPLSQFLGNLGLTTDAIRRMPSAQRQRTISKIERVAANIFHPNNGIAPDEIRLQRINGGLSDLKK